MMDRDTGNLCAYCNFFVADAPKTKGKGKVHPKICHEGTDRELYSFFNTGTTQGWVDGTSPQPI